LGFIDFELGEPSQFEIWNSKRLTANPQLVPLPSGGFINFGSDSRSAFDQLRSLTEVFARSEKDLLVAPPTGTLKADNYLYGNLDQKIAFKEPVKGIYIIDRVIAEEQFDLLAPEAVRWTASMIKFIHQNEAPICEEELDLTVQGQGTVTATYTAPWPINVIACHSSCRNYLPAGKTVTLRAATPGFQGWAGACSGKNDCVLLMDDDKPKSVTAIFDSCPTQGAPKKIPLQPGKTYPLADLICADTSPTIPSWNVGIYFYCGQPIPAVTVAGDAPVSECGTTTLNGALVTGRSFLKGRDVYYDALGWSTSHWSSFGSGSITIDPNYPYTELLIPGLVIQKQVLTGGTCFAGDSPYPCFFRENTYDAPMTFQVIQPDPVLTVVGTQHGSEIGPENGVFRINRTGGTSSPLSVRYEFSGLATSGIDYETMPGSVTIPAGQSSTTVTAKVKNNPGIEGLETLTLTVLPSVGTKYGIGIPDKATIQIVDGQVPKLAPGVTVPLNSLFAFETGPTISSWNIGLYWYCDQPAPPITISGDQPVTPCFGFTYNGRLITGHSFLQGTDVYYKAFGWPIPWASFDSGRLTVDSGYSPNSVTIPLVIIQKQVLTGQTCNHFEITYPCFLRENTYEGPMVFPVGSP
jgi:hypothetical protein